MCAVASSLANVRGSTVAAGDVSLDSALLALSGRIRLREGTTRSAEDIVRELWADVFGRADRDEARTGKAGAPNGATTAS